MSAQADPQADRRADRQLTGHGAPVTSVLDHLRRGLPDLTPTERRVARTVIAGYPASALDTVAGLAGAAGSSSASVVRLVQKLGFEGYSQFQAAVRGELAVRTSGPAQRMGRRDAGWTEPGTLARVAAAAAHAVSCITETVPASEFDAAVALLADPARPVRFLGGRATGLLAEYAQHHLSRARADVAMFPVERGRHSALLDVGRRDVLVVLDVRRYDADIAALASAAADRGASVVLVTDVLLSPIASFARVVLPVQVDAPSPFDSSVAVLTVMEALVTAAVAGLGESAVRRVQHWDALAEGPAE